MSTSIFLSSTSRDLAAYREAVYKAIEGLDGYHCIRMETFGARAWEADDFCRKKVGECDLFVGIIGHLHGSNPRDSESSYTEIEYEAAGNYKKPRLMFLAPKNFDVPADLIDEELELDANKRARQKAFRARVSADYVVDFFETPDDLAGRVMKAIRNWEQEQGRQDPTPKLGPFIPQTCDRRDQEADFNRLFPANLQRRPGFPQMYLLHGEERESHASLVQRFRYTEVQEYAQFKWPEQKAAVSLWELEWPVVEDLPSRCERLKSFLFEKLDPYSAFKENYDYSAPALRKLLSASLNSAVVIQHEIPARGWHKTDPELIKWYLEFWDEVKGEEAIPQCLIFLNILYPHAPKGQAWQLWLKAKRFYRKFANRQIEKSLRALCQSPERAPGVAPERPSCPCVMLEELSCVQIEHVRDWFRRNKIGLEDGSWKRKCEEIFTAGGGKLSDCKNMEDVEYALNMIHKQTVGRRVSV